jgi:hypothetical protein
MPLKKARRTDLSARAGRPDGVIYRQQYIRCRKQRCTKCPPDGAWPRTVLVWLLLGLPPAHPELLRRQTAPCRRRARCLSAQWRGHAVWLTPDLDNPCGSCGPLRVAHMTPPRPRRRRRRDLGELFEHVWVNYLTRDSQGMHLLPILRASEVASYVFCFVPMSAGSDGAHLETVQSGAR